MRYIVDGLEKPHPEETAQRPSRRTHGVSPVKNQFLHALGSGGPGLLQLVVAPGFPLFAGMTVCRARPFTPPRQPRRWVQGAVGALATAGAEWRSPESSSS